MTILTIRILQRDLLPDELKVNIEVLEIRLNFGKIITLAKIFQPLFEVILRLSKFILS